MSLILNIETSTSVCSVALAHQGELIALETFHEPNRHATHLTPLIQKIFHEHHYTFKDLSAIAVSAGPGSYTGLRIGYSTAKGLSYSLKKPLITIDTLQALAQGALSEIQGKLQLENTLIAPMIDARRMEVYCALFNIKLKNVTNTEALILTENIFEKELETHTIVCCGNGAFKVPKVLQHSKTIILENECSAKNMIELSYLKYKNSIFDDVAYSSPFYLKAPFITQAKNRL